MILTIEHLLLAFGDMLNDIRILQFNSLLCLSISFIVIFCYIYFIYVASFTSVKKGFIDRIKFIITYKEMVFRITTLAIGFIFFLSLLLFFELQSRKESIKENSQVIFQKIFSEYEGLTEEEKQIVKTNFRVRWYFDKVRKDLFDQNQ